MNAPRFSVSRVLITLFLLSVIAPMFPVGASAQAVACGDFASQDAAQVVLDTVPDFEDDLDPDRNGIACDHEAPDGPSEADQEYLDEIGNTLDVLDEQLNRFMEIYDLGADATDDDVREINTIADQWAEFPQDMGRREAPAAFEDFHDDVIDLADTFGETGTLWQEYWLIPSGDDGEEDALDAFMAAFERTQDELGDVQALFDEISTTDTSDDPVSTTDDAASWLDAVSEHADTLNSDLTLLMGDMLPSDANDDILAGFADAPDIAASLDSPCADAAECITVQELYLSFTESLALVPDLYDEWVESGMSAGMEDPTEDPVFTDLFDPILTSMDTYDDLTSAIETARDSVLETDSPTASDDPYLATIRETADNLIAEQAAMADWLVLRPESEIDKMENILINWTSLPMTLVMMEMGVPAGYGEISDTFFALVYEFETSAQCIVDWAEESAGPERDEAFDNLIESFETARNLYNELDAMLIEFGA